MRILVKRVALALGVGTALASLAAAYGLFSAQVELMPTGVHKRLIIPLSDSRSIALPIYSGSGEDVEIPGFLDGPVVRRFEDGRWQARWFCERDVFERKGEGDLLDVSCSGKVAHFPLSQPQVPASVAVMPTRLAVLSDIEGNAAFLDGALRALSIVDGNGAWTYGSGHLVVLGDSVDRGRDVFPVLWTLYRLSLQAEAAGGAVHVVLGNHEQYLLRSNISRANPEHLYTLGRLGGPEAAFATDTLIGGWLRRMPVALRLGRVLFVHGGVSAATVDAGMSVESLNKAIADYWPLAGTGVEHSQALDAVFGFNGVTQYRGYLMPLEGQYPLATQAEIDRVAKHFDVDLMVVAHTPVETVSRMHDGKVFAVNVNSDSAKSEVLVFENGVPKVIDIAVPRLLERPEQLRFRDLRLGKTEDRRLLGDMLRTMRRLSSLPHPY